MQLRLSFFGPTQASSFVLTATAFSCVTPFHASQSICAVAHSTCWQPALQTERAHCPTRLTLNHRDKRADGAATWR